MDLGRPITALLDGIVKIEESIGTKGLIALGFSAAACAAIIYAIELPVWAITTISMIITLYFGGSLATTNGKKV